MPSVSFDPSLQAMKQFQTYALDCLVTGIGFNSLSSENAVDDPSSISLNIFSRLKVR